MLVNFTHTGRPVSVPVSRPDHPWAIAEMRTLAGTTRLATERRLIEVAEVADYAFRVCEDVVFRCADLRAPLLRIVRHGFAKMPWRWTGAWAVTAIWLLY